MKRTTPFLTLIIFTAATPASGCAPQLARTPVVSEPQRARAGAQTAATQPNTLAGRGVSIADGDTLTVLDTDNKQGEGNLICSERG